MVDDSEVRVLAYALWEAAGSPEGRDVDYWLEAEQQLEPDAAAEPQSSQIETEARQLTQEAPLPPV